MGLNSTEPPSLCRPYGDPQATTESLAVARLACNFQSESHLPVENAKSMILQ
jgi:hypothetical protein